MKTPKRPAALLTAAQCICILAIALTLIPTLLPTFMLVSLVQKAQQYHSTQALEMYSIALCARDLLLGGCLFCAELEAVGLLNRMKKVSAFSGKNEAALGRVAGCLAVAGFTALLFGNSLVPYLLLGLPAIAPVVEHLLLPFLLLGVALMIRAVQLLMRRALSIQDENALTV